MFDDESRRDVGGEHLIHNSHTTSPSTNSTNPLPTIQELKLQGFELYGFHKESHRDEFSLLSNPNWECVKIQEVYLGKFTVYYLAAKKKNQLSRKERGCYVNH